MYGFGTCRWTNVVTMHNWKPKAEIRSGLARTNHLIRPETDPYDNRWLLSMFWFPWENGHVHHPFWGGFHVEFPQGCIWVQMKVSQHEKPVSNIRFLMWLTVSEMFNDACPGAPNNSEATYRRGQLRLERAHAKSYTPKYRQPPGFCVTQAPHISKDKLDHI